MSWELTETNSFHQQNRPVLLVPHSEVLGELPPTFQTQPVFFMIGCFECPDV